MPARWTITAFGETKGPTAWSRDPRCQVNLRALLNRLRAGWDPEEAITTTPLGRNHGPRPTRLVRAFGEVKGATAWSRHTCCKVTLVTLIRRLDRGVPAEEAITTPPFGLR